MELQSPRSSFDMHQRKAIEPDRKDVFAGTQREALLEVLRQAIRQSTTQ